MKNFIKQPAIALAAILLLAGATVRPALAEEHGRGEMRGNRHEDWREHEVHAREWHRHHVIREPGVIYAPPPIYSPPPPPSPGINLILPLNFR
jgi:hypothetical protein